jgi:zinc-ribbon family
VVIIWGWGGGKPKDLGPAVPLQCARCGREGFARYLTVTKWFRLYFIPVIPYETKHFLVCPVCTAATELKTKGERERVGRLVALTASLMSGATTEEAYKRALSAELNGRAMLELSVPADGQPRQAAIRYRLTISSFGSASPQKIARILHDFMPEQFARNARIGTLPHVVETDGLATAEGLRLALVREKALVTLEEDTGTTPPTSMQTPSRPDIPAQDRDGGSVHLGKAPWAG